MRSRRPPRRGHGRGCVPLERSFRPQAVVERLGLVRVATPRQEGERIAVRPHDRPAGYPPGRSEPRDLPLATVGIEDEDLAGALVIAVVGPVGGDELLYTIDRWVCRWTIMADVLGVGVVPQVDDIPFAMAGQGQQAAVKVALAMSRSGAATYVLMEEPENHLSYGGLGRLLSRVESLVTGELLFVTTHSSFVLNRLGLDKLLLLHNGRSAKLSDLGDDTVDYFRKLPGFDTLRLVLAPKLALVEGPSDAIVLERALREITGKDPLEIGVDIVSMGGLTFKRALEICTCLSRQAVVLQDNDGRDPEVVKAEVAYLLDEPERVLLVSDPTSGKTLEPQLLAVNDEALMRKVLEVTAKTNLETWMHNNKTEAALRVLVSKESISFPTYIGVAHRQAEWIIHSWHQAMLLPLRVPGPCHNSLRLRRDRPIVLGRVLELHGLSLQREVRGILGLA